MKKKRGRPQGSCKVPESLISFWICIARNPKDRENCEKNGNARQKTYLKEAIKILAKREDKTPTKYNKRGRIRRKK